MSDAQIFISLTTAARSAKLAIQSALSEISAGRPAVAREILKAADATLQEHYEAAMEAMRRKMASP